MGKCTICGENSIISYLSVLDGNVCNKCDKQFFEYVDSDIRAINYNKPEAMRFITGLSSESGYKKAIYALNEIQSKYKYSINSIVVENDKLIIKSKTIYRNRLADIIISISEDISEYTIEYNGTIAITKRFEEV